MTDQNFMPLINVTRAGMVESIHHGALVVARPNGEIVLGMGDVEQLIFPRSAIKIFQAIPLVVTGAADAFGFTNEELALACASHAGEPQHVALAASMLQKIGCTLDDLECGAHAPTRKASAQALAIAGEKPSALHNNCSGKHAGMLATAKHLGLPLKGYTAPDHPLQQRIRAALEVASGVPLEHTPCGVDGCSVPTWAMPINALATAFARIGSGEGVSSDIAMAADRLIHAVWDHPFIVGGTHRFDSDVMTALPRQLFTKVGAEGVFCGYFPEADFGVAIKCADGSERGASAIMAAVIQSVLKMPDDMPENLAKHMQPKLTNWRGIAVGEIQPRPEFVEELIMKVIGAVMG